METSGTVFRKGMGVETSGTVCRKGMGVDDCVDRMAISRLYGVTLYALTTE